MYYFTIEDLPHCLQVEVVITMYALQCFVTYDYIIQAGKLPGNFAVNVRQVPSIRFSSFKISSASPRPYYTVHTSLHNFKKSNFNFLSNKMQIEIAYLLS